LVHERATLRRQRVVGELEVQRTRAGTQSGAQFTGRQVDELALHVGFHDRLTDEGAVLQVSADGFETIVRIAASRLDEEVEAAGAGARRSAEATKGRVARGREALAEVPGARSGRGEDRAKTLERID